MHHLLPPCRQVPYSLRDGAPPVRLGQSDILILSCHGVSELYMMFLALLDFVSRATCQGAGVRRPSVVCKLRFLRKRCMDPGQILWVVPSPPYLQTIFFYFKIFNFQFFYVFFFVFVNMGPYGSKISKRYSTFHPI